MERNIDHAARALHGAINAVRSRLIAALDELCAAESILTRIIQENKIIPDGVENVPCEEDEQLAQIDLIRWSYTVSIDAANSCLAAIDALRAIAPCSERVRAHRDRRLHDALEWYRQILLRLEISGEKME